VHLGKTRSLVRFERFENRRLRILELLGDGGKLRSTCIANHLGCSLKTVKRELETLRLAGRIEFIGPSKTGTYQLVEKVTYPSL
jgi:DNA-binding IclR family transcriptional regulator